MKRWLCLLLALLLVALSTGCGKAAPKPEDFITIIKKENKGEFKIGDTRQFVRSILDTTTLSRYVDDGAWLEYADDILVAARVEQIKLQTKPGISLESSREQILPAYAPLDVTVVEDLPERLRLEKVVDGVRYTTTFRFYADGSIKTITITNTEKFDEPVEGIHGGIFPDGA